MVLSTYCFLNLRGLIRYPATLRCPEILSKADYRYSQAQSMLYQMSLVYSGGFNIGERTAFRETVFLCIIEKVR